MTTSRSLRRRAAWAAPVVTAAVIAGSALLPSAASASAHPVLPARTPAELLQAVQGSTVTSLSGEVVETARLGVPSLPGNGSAASLSWQSLVAGTHTARVWVDGPERQRIAVLGQLSEADVARSGKDVWTYSSSTRKTVHYVLPAEDAALPAEQDPAGSTPAGSAQQLLKAIDPTTRVSVDLTARVAGRAAYTLVLRPRDSRSTVRKVLIAVDAANSTPLRVQVFAAGAKPVFETAFQSISFTRPAASVFHFSAPTGSVVSEQTLRAPQHATHTGTSRPDKPGPTVFGSGWASVVELATGKDVAATTGGSSDLVNRLTTKLPDGSRLLRTALVNVLMTPDGRVLAGAVTPAVLADAAAGRYK